MLNKIFGIVLYTKKIKENDLYVKILSKNDTIISGIVYGGDSRKKKYIYQIGYFLNVSLSKKNINSPYIIESDIGKPFLAPIINDKYKIHCLLSIISLINVSIIEGQTVKNIYKITDEFINKLINKKKWIIYYCKWLFDLLKVIGYEIDYQSNTNKEYFDINLLGFTNIKKNNTFFFPHKFLSNKIKINYNDMKIIFLIFENICLNNHLNNSINKLPNNYINFKKIILNYLHNN